MGAMAYESEVTREEYAEDMIEDSSSSESASRDPRFSTSKPS